MVSKIVSIMLLPLFTYMLVGGIKDLLKDLNVKDNANFLSALVWIFGVVTVLIVLVLYVMGYEIIIKLNKI